MSKLSAISKDTVYTPIEPAADRYGEYLELIRRLFHRPSVVAVVGSSSDHSATDVCGGIATELAVSGKRVAVVRMDTLLRMNPIPVPGKTDFMPAKGSNVWYWPSPEGHQIEFFQAWEPSPAGNWLDTLRRNFDSVLLDCPEVEAAPGVVEAAAMADSAVLVVEAGRTPKQEIQRDQRALQLNGVQLAGCILIRRR